LIISSKNCNSAAANTNTLKKYVAKHLRLRTCASPSWWKNRNILCVRVYFIEETDLVLGILIHCKKYGKKRPDFNGKKI
jgi:hypothetical protein